MNCRISFFLTIFYAAICASPSWATTELRAIDNHGGEFFHVTIEEPGISSQRAIAIGSRGPDAGLNYGSVNLLGPGGYNQTLTISPGYDVLFVNGSYGAYYYWDFSLAPGVSPGSPSIAVSSSFTDILSVINRNSQSYIYAFYALVSPLSPSSAAPEPGAIGIFLMVIALLTVIRHRMQVSTGSIALR